MDLVLKLNYQLKKTKKELDALIQLNQRDLATTFKYVIPTVSTTVPSTLEASLEPTAPPAITFSVTTKSTTTCASRDKAT